MTTRSLQTCDEFTTIETELNRSAIICDHRGILMLPDSQAMIVSDLHLEKGAAFARRGLLHPPYDTAQTLRKLESLLNEYNPKTVISLGDSFHDAIGADHLPGIFLDQLKTMQKGRDWIWIAGNHDPEPPKNLGGDYIEEFYIENVSCRHEPKRECLSGEISGHLHPAAVISRRGKSVRRPCFATDRTRMIMPAFGATTGGLSLSHKAFTGMFDQSQLYAHVMGKDRIYPIPYSKMRR